MCDVFLVLENKIRTLDEPLRLLRHSERFRVTNAYLEAKRAEFLPKVLQEMNKDYYEGVECEEKQLSFVQTKYLSKFYLYKGVLYDRRLAEARNSPNAPVRRQSAKAAAVARAAAVPFGDARCSLEWPLCVHDFAFKSKQTSFFVFRVANLRNALLEEYFYAKPPLPAHTPAEEEQKQESGGGVTGAQQAKVLQADLVVERNVHWCKESGAMDLRNSPMQR